MYMVLYVYTSKKVVGNGISEPSTVCLPALNGLPSWKSLKAVNFESLSFPFPFGGICYFPKVLEGKQPVWLVHWLVIGILCAKQMRFGIVILLMVQNACVHQVVRASIGSQVDYSWYCFIHDIKWEEQIHINCCNHQISELYQQKRWMLQRRFL